MGTPRFISTVDALEARLCDGPCMRRHEAPGDFGLPETSFNICAFWRIDALACIGRQQQARDIFEALLAVCNPSARGLTSGVAGRAHLVHRRDPGHHLVDAVLAQRAHAFGQCRGLQFLGARAGLDLAADGT